MKALENLMIEELSQLRRSASSLECRLGNLDHSNRDQLGKFLNSLIALERKSNRLERLLDAMAA